MKRDMELFRQLAFKIEAAEEPFGSPEIAVDGYDKAEIAYHLDLMHEKGLVCADRMGESRGIEAVFWVFRLTNAGHDLAEASRNDTIWKSAMTTMARKGVGVTVEILMIYLKQKVAEQMGLTKAAEGSAP